MSGDVCRPAGGAGGDDPFTFIVGDGPPNIFFGNSVVTGYFPAGGGGVVLTGAPVASVGANHPVNVIEERNVMDDWIVLGEYYVKPIDWEELHVIEPDGVAYSAYRHHIVSHQKILIGTAPTPAAAARMISAQHAAIAGGHDPHERRRQAGL